MLIPLPTFFALFLLGSRPLDLLTDRLKCLPSSVAVLITCPTSELPTVPRELASLVHFEFVVDDLSEADRCEFARFAFGKRNGVVVDAKWFASNTRVSRSQWRSQECRSGGGVQGTLDPQNIVLAPLFMKAAAKYGKGTSHRGIKGKSRARAGPPGRSPAPSVECRPLGFRPAYGPGHSLRVHFIKRDRCSFRDSRWKNSTSWWKTRSYMRLRG